MGAVVWTLLVTLLCGTSQAYVNSVRPTSFPGPRYDSCRETIEDLRALLEITQSLRPDMTYACPTCSSGLSEELIIKLVNALIFTATHHCGFNGRGCGGIPANNGGGVGGIAGGGDTGSLIGGENNINAGGGGIVNRGGDNYGRGVIDGGGSNTGGVNPGVASNPGSGGSDPLLGVHLLDGHSILGLDVGSQPVLNLGLGSSSGSGSYSAQPGGALPATTSQSPQNDNSLLGVNLGGTKLAEVDLGPSHNNGGSTGGITSPTQTVLDGTATGSPGSVSNGIPLADNQGLGGVTHGILGGNSPGTLSSDPSSVGGATSPVSSIVPDSSRVDNNPTSISTATSQVAGAPVSSVPTVAGATSPGTGSNSPDATLINSGNKSTVQNSTDTVNIINPPKN